MRFQSTPPGRRQQLETGSELPLPAFQSTPPRRRRRVYAQDRRPDGSFNPRLRAGGDQLNQFWKVRKQKFQSKPPRRRRPRFIQAGAATFGFQSTPPRRRRPRITTSGRRSGSFNPRLRAGGDVGSLSEFRRISWFQSTPPRRRRLKPGQAQPMDDRVSIHASAQEAT